eukprot:29809-Prymnesium_polylepis.1
MAARIGHWRCALAPASTASAMAATCAITWLSLFGAVRILRGGAGPPQQRAAQALHTRASGSTQAAARVECVDP